MRNCGKRSFRKHRENKDSDERVTLKAYENMYEILKISEKFDNLDKMETISSESKVKMEGSGKWLVTALALKTKARSKKYKKARYDIGNVSMKDLVNKNIKFWTNWMLLIKVHSQHPKNRHQKQQLMDLH